MRTIRRLRRPGALRALMRALRAPARLFTHLLMGSSLRHPRLRTGRLGRRPSAWSPSDRYSPLATVIPAQPFDRLVRHRRHAVGVEELASVPRPEVVLQRPYAGGEVRSRISQSGSAHVHQTGQALTDDQDVGETVVAVNEDPPWPWLTERAACRVERVNVTQDLTKPAGNQCRLPADRLVGQQNARQRASQQPVVAVGMEES